MKQLKYLFDFIQNLSKSEKRFFRLYAQLYNSSNNKNYLLLFDILESPKKYDENLIIEKIIKKIPNANLRSVKAYLKTQLFTALRLFHRNNIESLKYYDDLGIAKLLMTKGQYYYAQEILERLEKETLQKERHLPYIAVQDYLNGCIGFQKDRDLNTIKKTISTHKKALKQIDNLREHIAMRLLYRKVINISYEFQHDSQKEVLLQTIFEEELENKPLQDIEGIHAKYYYLQSKFHIYRNTGKNIVEKISLLEELLDVVYSAIEKGIFQKGEQWVTLVNLADLYTRTANKEGFYKIIEELNAILIYFDEAHKNDVLYWTYTRIYEFYYNFPDEKLLLNLLEDTEQWLENTKTPVNEKYKSGLRFTIALYQFALENYDATLQQLHLILLRKAVQLDDLYFIQIKGLYIVCQYELKAYSVAKKEMLALKRKLKRHELTTEIAKKLLRILTSIINIEHQDYDLSKYYQKIIDVFENNKVQQSPTPILSFLLKWAEGKMLQ